MDLSGCRFIYADKASELYGLRFVNCETSEYKRINGTTKSVGVYNGKNKRNYYLSDDYSNSPISIEVEIASDSLDPFSPTELREIENWLFNRQGYYKLYINPEDDCTGETYEIIDGETKRFYFNCRFVNPSKLNSSGGTVGFKATMECDSHLLWQDSISKIFEPEVDSVLRLFVNSDGNDYIYPKVTITMGTEGGDISIINNSDDVSRITSFKILSTQTEFTMNSETNRISGDNYTKFYDKNFIRLIPGENALSIAGDVAKIEFEWENRKYL